jgi:hypothetical protein
MAAIAITAASVIASAAATIRREYNAAATLTAGQLVYLNASNLWALVDSDAGLGTGINDLRGITLGGGAVNQPVAVCTNDPAFTPGGTLSNGLVVYGFTTAGAISFADIPTTGAYPVVVGVAKSTLLLNLQPFASGVII